VKSKFKVALLANLKTNAPHWDEMPQDQWDDLDSEKRRLTPKVGLKNPF
jgi:hypothetical protein